MTTVTTKAPKQIAINDIGSAEDFLAAVEQTLRGDDGDVDREHAAVGDEAHGSGLIEPLRATQQYREIVRRGSGGQDEGGGHRS